MMNLGNLAKIGAKALNKTEKAIAKKAFQTMHSVNDKMEPINHAIGKAEKAVVKTIKSPIINAKEVDGSRERLSNFYTGKKINPLHMAVIGGGYLAATNSYNGASHALQPLRLATQN